jgi:uncharacterized protein YcfJ
MSQSSCPISSQLTPREYVRFWWAIIWRSSLLGFFAGSILGAVVGMILGALGYARFGAAGGAVAGGFANFVVSYFVIRHVLGKQFAGFKLVVERPAGIVS